MYFQRFLDSMSQNQSENYFCNIAQSHLIMVVGNCPLLKGFHRDEYLFRHHCKWRQCIYFIAMVTKSSMKYINTVHKEKRMKKNKWYTALEMQKKDQTNKLHGLRNN